MMGRRNRLIDGDEWARLHLSLPPSSVRRANECGDRRNRGLQKWCGRRARSSEGKDARPVMPPSRHSAPIIHRSARLRAKEICDGHVGDGRGGGRTVRSV
jgi:hypothetical protein